MNAVGIDVSKGKSMVAIMRPFGEIVSTPFEIKHTSSDINSLIEIINSVEGESHTTKVAYFLLPPYGGCHLMASDCLSTIRL